MFGTKQRTVLRLCVWRVVAKVCCDLTVRQDPDRELIITPGIRRFVYTIADRAQLTEKSVL